MDYRSVKSPYEYEIDVVNKFVAAEYMAKYHYSKTCGKSSVLSLGLFYPPGFGRKMIGGLVFGIPCSENVRSSLFGKEYKDFVVELHRSHILDGTPKNTESWFISRCIKAIKKLRPEVKGIISFSDLSEGHVGIVYRAANALFCGLSPGSTLYRDSQGKLRHPRQNGVNLSKEEILKRGWIPEKRLGMYRYVWILDRKFRNKLLLTVEPYPNRREENGRISREIKS